MPFKSDAQRRFMYAAEARGDVPKGTADKWQKETGDKNLPEYTDKKAHYAVKIAEQGYRDAFIAFGLLDKEATCAAHGGKPKKTSKRLIRKKIK